MRFKGNRGLDEFVIYNPIKSGSVDKMTEGKQPDYDVVSFIKTGKEKDFSMKIGSGWKNDKGISISLNALPLGNQIFLFERKEKD